jgi:hypothetical protein
MEAYELQRALKPRQEHFKILFSNSLRSGSRIYVPTT